MPKNQKAFASIIILLFLLFFIFITVENKKNDLSDLIVIKQVSTQKENIYLNFETILNNSLDDCKEDPLIVKEEVILKAHNFTSKNNFFIRNLITKKETSINLIELNNLIKVITYKPTKNILIKEIHITNGILKNQNLGFRIITRNYSETFLFPENYFIRKVVFC